MLMFHFYQIVFYFIIYFIFNQNGGGVMGGKRKPTMVGEPLNPSDYENALNLVHHQDISKDMSTDDGTYNDIIESPIRGQNDIKPWPNGIVPYLLDDNFNTTDRAMIAKAIQFIEINTCIRIISKTTEENYILVRKNIYGTDCNSFIGMQSGKQIINLAQRCIQKVGSTVHEFMHALGFLHEQSRTDRENYIIVRYENIIEGSEHNFEKYDPPAGNFAGLYDPLSLTHYSNTAFTKNGLHTLDTLVGDIKLGQREKLSQLDIDKLNIYYNCSKLNFNEEPFRNFENNLVESSSEEITQTMKSTIKQDSGKFRDICNDFDEEYCQFWASYGYCTQSPIFMSVYCKKTCKKCDIGCTDMNKKCGGWAVKNYCEKYSHYMDLYCGYSCWTC